MYLHTEKQYKYFDEVIRLHSEEGLSDNAISKRIPVNHATVSRWINAYNHGGGLVSSSEKLEEEFKEMYGLGMSIHAIARVTGISRSTIRRKIATFVPEREDIVMQTPEEQSKDLLEAQKKIKALEEELRKAKLARDAYDEMINVAESKFNIPIRKKAGAKR